jgi:hypothetical protein
VGADETILLGLAIDAMQLHSQPDLAMQEIRARKGLGREQDEG